ncbi:hypothetical protein RFZ45_19605, partial [Acinetobacter baumannii]|nr:hypothetical protein [Acinetobacter baumannii]
MASRLQNTPLMEGESAETAASETPSVACQTEFYFFKSRNSAFFFVHGVASSCIGKGIDIIHLFLTQR